MWQIISSIYLIGFFSFFLLALKAERKKELKELKNFKAPNWANVLSASFLWPALLSILITLSISSCLKVLPGVKKVLLYDFKKLRRSSTVASAQRNTIDEPSPELRDQMRQRRQEHNQDLEEEEFWQGQQNFPIRNDTIVLEDASSRTSSPFAQTLGQMMDQENRREDENQRASIGVIGITHNKRTVNSYEDNQDR